MSSKETFTQISPSEFFYRNRDLAGFSNPTRSLYTAVREFVENSLDACDQKGILADVHMSIKAVDAEKPDPKQYILTVRDNGPGIESNHVPLAFGTVLYGSKFGLKQARGMFGLGATMAILYGQITTNKPVVVKSSTDGKIQDEYEMLLDIQKNKPVILKHETKEVSKSGLSVSICLEGDYAKAGTKIRDYVYQTSLITPYATITFDDPKGEKYRYTKVIRTMPPSPTIIRPHPHGIDVETIRRMLLDTNYQIPAVDNNMILKVRKELGLANKNLSHSEIMDKTQKKWKTLTRPVRIIMALMSFLKMDFEKLSKTTIEEIEAGMVEACRDTGVSLVGGETADMPDTYLPGEHDLVGVITGVAEKDKIITGETIQPGDVVLGLPASGLHTNGYSLARKLFFEIGGYDVNDTIPELEKSVGLTLLEPHINYTNHVFGVLDKEIGVKGIAHITGGGLVENIPRILPDGCCVEIHRGSWPGVPIFNVMQSIGNVDENEMYRTFNMGIGMIIIAAPDQVNSIKKIIDVHEVGFVVAGGNQVNII